MERNLSTSPFTIVKKLQLENFGINVIDEITKFLSSKEIVSLFGINQYFHHLWNSRVSQKIFNMMPNFNIEIAPRERWLYHQMRMMCQNKNYPKNTKITSNRLIYCLASSFKPQPEFKLFIDGQIRIWKPECKNKKIISCSNISNIEFAIHVYAYEAKHLILMFTNNRSKHIYKNEEINEFEIREFDFLTVANIFYLPKADFLILQCFSGQIIYMRNNGEIVSNRKLGSIQKYKTLPWKNDSFIAIINDKILLIEPFSTKLLCECYKSDISKLPDLLVDEETKKLIIHTGKKSGWKIKIPPLWIEFAKFGKKMFKIQNHTYILTQSNILRDSYYDHQYQIKDDVENIFIDGNYVLAHCISSVFRTNSFQLFKVGEKMAIIFKQLQINIKVLNFAYPYIIYSTNRSQEGLSEVGFYKF